VPRRALADASAQAPAQGLWGAVDGGSQPQQAAAHALRPGIAQVERGDALAYALQVHGDVVEEAPVVGAELGDVVGVDRPRPVLPANSASASIVTMSRASFSSSLKICSLVSSRSESERV